MSTFRMSIFRIMKRVWLAAALLSIAALPLSAQQTLEAKPEVKGPGLFIFFEGDQPGNTIALVAKTLFENQDLLRSAALPLAYRMVEPGDSICKYLFELDYPLPCGPDILKIVERLNPKTLVSKGLQIGQAVFLPDLSLAKYTVTRRVPTDVPQAAMPAIEKSWKELKAEVVRRPDGLAFIRFEAYRVYVATSSDAASAKLFQILTATTRPENIKISVVTGDSATGKQHSNPPITETEWRDWCASGPTGSTIRYRDLTATYGGGDSSNPPAVVAVHIIDGPINEPENLKGALGSGAVASTANTNTSTAAGVPVAGPVTPAATPASPTCTWTKFSKPEHHATHMAGIIASRDNGSGFVGVAPQARIVPFPWLAVDGAKAIAASPNRDVDLSALIDRNNLQGIPIPVYLLATEFQPQPGEEGQAPDRFRDPIASSIKGSFGFFVVAAGQTDETRRNPKALSPEYEYSPQNLGDQENVVLVTACTSCASKTPKILESTNYSAGREQPVSVHVAAPGGSAIGGWVKNGEFAVAGGTSQAAAFVAGLAAQMIGTYRDFYKDGLAVKKRLQSTSYPANWSKDDEAKLSVGIVDPMVALFDPTKHWLKQDGRWREVPIKAFAQDESFQYRDGTYKRPAAFGGAALLRVVRTKDGAAASERRWDVYADLNLINDKFKRGMITRIRNQIPTGNLVLCDGSPIAWLAVEDLIVAATGIACR